MPSAAEMQLRSERANRDAARSQLDGQIARIRDDIDERGVTGRIADEAVAKALAALDEAGKLASESKGVIGGIVALLALWFLRKPILSTLAELLGADDEQEGNDDDDY
ncbi:MAG: hypothetical protein FJX31_04470 [Alphaproteobacteria bacterium]|nr:hypothetical protein [Alphaproteobacteria bacterium]